jgi:ketosteroid isomerase-like protein
MTTTSDAHLIADARARNEQVWRAAGALLYAGELEQFLGYWHDDARYEGAYPIAGRPVVVEGRDQLAAMFGGMIEATTSIQVHDVRIHQTDDPDLVFVEERMEAELPDGGRYENRLAIRVRFRDGRIAEMLDYYGQEAHTDLMRRLGLSA